MEDKTDIKEKTLKKMLEFAEETKHYTDEANYIITQFTNGALDYEFSKMGSYLDGTEKIDDYYQYGFLFEYIEKINSVEFSDKYGYRKLHDKIFTNFNIDPYVEKKL
tara:strand:- start:74 stop:394 length:321 start_codon:yes stop_codon:yes gene_type:complete